MSGSDKEVAMHRLTLALVGACAGLAAWFFGELAETMFHRPRLFLFTVTAVMGGFGLFLGIVGPLRWASAALGAAVMAVLIAGLMTWDTTGFDTLEPFFDSGLPFSAMALLLFVGTPFVSAALQRTGGWRDYALLFDTAWAILVRYLAAWLFTAVVWGIVYLSDALFEIVGVTVIDDLLELDPVPFALTGMFLGLAMAIMHELRDYVSPFLVLRLFRVILPVLTLVVAVFLIALPLRGMDQLFGSLSVAATLMAVAIAAITLVTSALDRSPEDMVRAPLMRGAARIMCLLLPLLCAAAAWAVWLRVDAYGWTPARVAAAFSAGLLLVYALAYAGSVLLPDWAGRIRQTNLFMALAVLALSALWLTPILNDTAISTQSQVSRFKAGKVTVDDVALWEMKNDWGRAGAAGLAELQALADAGAHPAASDLSLALQRLTETDSRFVFERDRNRRKITENDMTELLDQIVVFPEGQSITAEELRSLQPHIHQQLTESCPLADAEGPGCVMILDDLNPHKPGQEGVLLQRTAADEGVKVQTLYRRNGGLETGGGLFVDVSGAALSAQSAALIAAMNSGEIRIEPSQTQMITFGGISVIP
ncbi:DUF4153 domain-containing protein [Marinovum sp. 2_MG-2023]|uniref:DUF4153 domain-containing protein n=1 Tax=unclassified Marinovum TaxID=2647166 RepID=UPI0026E1D611|nr:MULTISPECIES: DUF4153 domain-containing protein [unclassified Marinovum]MDO6728749.1 DUF4153 domain-containing protein [Marinovum sp. 2_MG-2023]MDO6777835.1 DUF4153 domain-containing protein [Marinovum sp. 1_MG-2023]